MTGLRLEQKWYTTYLLFPLLFHLESHFLFFDSLVDNEHQFNSAF